MGKKVTMKDLADEFGVSIVTISKALADKDGVSSELKENIKRRANEQGYTVDIRAKSMKTGIKYNIGIILPYYYTFKDSNFYFEVYKDIIEILDEKGYYATLHILTQEALDDLIIPRFCKDESVDGLILLGQVRDEYLYKITELKMPTVFADVNKELPNVVSVEFDNYLAGFELCRYLYKKGHKEIGFVGKINGSRSILDRYLGYQRYLIEKGNMNAEKYNIVDRGEDNEVMREYILPEQMPTAYICNCDITAFYFIRNLQSKGIRVPEDISVITFDNTIYSELSTPKISAFETNIYELANNAVENILKLVNKDEITNYKASIKGRLIERDTVKEKATVKC